MYSVHTSQSIDWLIDRFSSFIPSNVSTVPRTLDSLHSWFTPPVAYRILNPWVVRNALKIIRSREMAQKREESDGTDHLTRVKRNHAEGETFIWIPATALVVRDPFVSTVCSGCLNTEQSTGTIRLQHCSKCKFLKYCSRGCQVKTALSVLDCLIYTKRWRTIS